MMTNEKPQRDSEERTVILVVAYPGDETLFAGGQILMTPDWRWHIVSMFAGSKPDIEARFKDALNHLGATGEIIGIPENFGKPTLQLEAKPVMMRLLETHQPDTIITHSPVGECRKLLGRDVLGRIVTQLWNDGATAVGKLWIFAYEDDNVDSAPIAADEADRSICLMREVWNEKRNILMTSYGFSSDSFVVRTCPTEEAFYCFNHSNSFREWKKAHVRTSNAADTKTPSGRGRRPQADGRTPQ